MSWITRLKNAIDPRRLDRDLADEIRDHIERRAADLEQQGLPPAEARRRAALAFGNAACIEEQSRDLKLWSTLADTRQDLRYAWRGLLRNPLFASAAVLSLGLAIGANTAIFSIVDAVVLRPLPVPDPGRLFTLATTAETGSGLFSYPLYEELRDAAGGQARIALFDAPERVEGQLGSAAAPREELIHQPVSADAFEILGVAPSLGRLLSAAEDSSAASRPSVVLSDDCWRRHFGADPAIAGKPLIVNGRTLFVAGVARPGFTGVEPGKFVDIWTSIAISDPGIFSNSGYRPFRLLGRLAPGVARAQLAAGLQPTFHRHQESRIGLAMPEPMQKQLREMTILAPSGSSGISAFRRTMARPLWILMAVAACILLIACANVAGLLLARAAARSAEMSLRVALGARRARLMRQLLTESLAIAALAGLAGWLLARAAAPALVAMVSTAANPVRLDLPLDLRLLLFSASLCALSALAFGSPPRLAGNPRPGHARPPPRRRPERPPPPRPHFVGLQVAFAFALVACGAGFLFSLRNLAAVDPGFDSKGVTVMTVVNDLGYRERDRQLVLLQEMRLRAAALPQVQGAATAWMAMFSGTPRSDRVVVPGKPPAEKEEIFYRISPGFFSTLRTPLLAGRDLTVRDNDDEPVPTIVNRAFARKYYATESVLGRQFQRTDGVRHRIVGLAANSHFGDLHRGPEPIAYMPMKPPRGFTLYVRSTLDAGSVAKMVDREAAALGSGMHVRDVTTLDALVGGTILTERLLAALGGAFALLGLVLAAIGLFGLLNYSVARRTREIGIRAALGARRWPLCGLVLKDLAAALAAGLAAGIAGSLAFLRLARSLLFEIRPADPLVLGTALAVFLAAAALAAGLPARRAASVDPIIALREE